MKLYIIAAFLVSSDIFLVWRIGGFSFRAAQFVLALIVGAGLVGASFAKPADLRWPLGFTPLLIWGALNFAFLLNGQSLSRNVGYMTLQLFTVALVFVAVQEFGNRERLNVLLRWYVYAYSASAILGIIQFVLPCVGVDPPLVRQWWIPGVFARVNGMTYEPSYYAMYMLCGWVTIGYLKVNRSELLPAKRLNTAFVLMTLALILCSSRMGWMMMAVWSCLRMFWWFRNKNFKALRRAALVVFGVVVTAAIILAGPGSFLVKGLGVSEDSGDFSRAQRQADFDDTIMVFKDHPVLGVGLGGVGPEIAHMRHMPQVDRDDEVRVEGQCTSAEILAGTGIVGFMVYAVYMGTLFTAPFRLKRASVELRALAWGLIFLIAILQFNQTILRLYVWFHIALLSACYSIERRAENQGYGAAIGLGMLSRVVPKVGIASVNSDAAVT